ncbi:MAG TPA: hypothetical protein DEA43_02195 [Candidatus Moranbacteria bacterium]|nr:hypothetical protein [Candidatus Moranbacteria bacterium]HBT45675.1 hypothetical protein [Candidatus Moranbacteria bacterium]
MGVLNRKQIAKMLPHTGPMLLPERFIWYEKDETLFGEGEMIIEKETFARKFLRKMLGGFFPSLYRNSFFIEHHFGCFPGVMLIEFAAQTAALLVKTASPEIKGLPIILRFKDQPPEFGRFQTVYDDFLIAKVRLIKKKRGMYYFETIVTKQDGTIVLETGMTGAAAPEK